MFRVCLYMFIGIISYNATFAAETAQQEGIDKIMRQLKPQDHGVCLFKSPMSIVKHGDIYLCKAHLSCNRTEPANWVETKLPTMQDRRATCIPTKTDPKIVKTLLDACPQKQGEEISKQACKNGDQAYMCPNAVPCANDRVARERYEQFVWPPQDAEQSKSKIITGCEYDYNQPDNPVVTRIHGRHICKGTVVGCRVNGVVVNIRPEEKTEVTCFAERFYVPLMCTRPNVVPESLCDESQLRVAKGSRGEFDCPSDASSCANDKNVVSIFTRDTSADSQTEPEHYPDNYYEADEERHAVH